MLLATDGLTRLLALGILRQVDAESVQVHRLVAAYAAVELGELTAVGRTAVETSLIHLLSPRIKATWGLANLPLSSAHLNNIWPCWNRYRMPVPFNGHGEKIS